MSVKFLRQEVFRLLSELQDDNVAEVCEKWLKNNGDKHGLQLLLDMLNVKVAMKNREDCDSWDSSTRSADSNAERESPPSNFKDVVIKCLKSISLDFTKVPNLVEYYASSEIVKPFEDDRVQMSDYCKKLNHLAKEGPSTSGMHLGENGKFELIVPTTIIKTGMIIIYSPPQSGKSNFIITRAIYSMLDGYTPVVVLRNMTGDSNQLANRIEAVSESITAALNLYNIEERKFEVSIIRGSALDKQKHIKELEQSLSGVYPRVVICLGNDAQLGRVVDVVKEKEDNNFVLFIDEIDYVDYGKKKDGSLCGTASQLDFLKSKAYQTYGISATPLDSIFSEAELLTSNCMTLTQSPDFRGFRDIMIRLPESEEEVYALNSEANYNQMVAHDPNLKPFLESFLTSPIERGTLYSGAFSEVLPNICLIKNTRFIKNQIELAKGINNHYPDFTTVVYNGTGVLLYFKNMPRKIHIQGKEVSRKEFTDLDISDVLQFFYDNGGYKKFPRIIIIAGDLAGRSISYVPRNYRWHLTDMYYTPSQNTTIPDMIQAVGRLCGRNRGLSHLVLHTTKEVAKSLYDGFNFTDELIARSIAQPLIEAENQQPLSETMLSIKMNKEKMPARRSLTSKVQVRKSDFNTVSGEDGGRDISSYKYEEVANNAARRAREIIARENEESKTREIPQEEFTRLTREMFPRWCRADSKIATFMRCLEPSKRYTKEEFRLLCRASDIKVPGQLTRQSRSSGRTHSQGFGMIIKKNEDDTFQLFPELVVHFNKYF